MPRRAVQGRVSVAGPLALVAIALHSGLARGDCAPATRQSPCIDADSLWIPAVPGPFVSIPSAQAEAPGTFSVRLSATGLSRPIVLTADSPDPQGRELAVVEGALGAGVGFSYVPVAGLGLELTAAFLSQRSGTGLGGVTSQNAEPLPAARPRDLRMALQHDLIAGTARPRSVSRHATPLSPREPDGAETPAKADGIGLATRYEVSLPTGDESTFAGARGVVGAPSLLIALKRGPVFAGSQAGARLRLPVELGGTRLGTQLVSSVGAGIAPLQGSLSLALSLEAWLLASPAGPAPRHRDEPPSPPSIASEWFFSVRVQTKATALAVGGGTAIPLSSEERTRADGSSSTEHFAGVTSARLRGVLTLTHTFGGD